MLQFCSKPPGSWIAAAIAFLLGFWWWSQHEVNVGKGICNAQHAEAATNEIARLGKVYVDADTRSTVRTDKSETVNSQNKVIVRVIHDQAAAMPDRDAVCIAGPIADRLRDISP